MKKSLRIAIRLAIIILSAVVLCISLFACGSGKQTDSNAPPDEIRDYETVSVVSDAFGFPAFSAVSEAPDVVTSTVAGGNVLNLVSHKPGTARVNVEDCFGHKAYLTVTVADDEKRSITYEAEKCTEVFLNAADFGVTSGSNKDSTAALQAAIDKAAETKDTVYLYPGIYKVKELHIRDGVTLKMYSGIGDATDGYDSSYPKKISSGRVTVLKQTRIMNNDLHAFGHDGDSNFTISGGVLDNAGSNQSMILLALSENVRIENCLFKDIKSNHMIQLAGCKNVVIDNCIFAGYTDNGTFTCELVQIEPTSTGAFGSGSNAPQLFAVGEAIGNRNISITNCYFGPSTTAGAPNIGIGHHSYTKDPNCDSLLIRNCVFDGCMFAGVRLPNITNAEITECTFRTITKYKNLYASTQPDPAEICIFSYDFDVSYTSPTDNKTVVMNAMPPEVSGSHGVKITNNKFILTDGTDKRALEIIGTGELPSLFCTNTVFTRQDTYDGAFYQVSGYLPSCNYIGDLTVRNNEITVEGVCGKNDSVMDFFCVVGLDIADNKLNLLNGADFICHDFDIKGLWMEGTVLAGADAKTRYVSIGNTDKILTLNSASGTFSVTGSARSILKLSVSGEGRIECSSDRSGQGFVTAIPEEGYVFKGWFDGDKPIDTEFKVSAAKTLTAKFDKQ